MFSPQEFKIIRERENLTQAQAARLAGIPNYFSEKREQPENQVDTFWVKMVLICRGLPRRIE